LSAQTTNCRIWADNFRFGCLGGNGDGCSDQKVTRAAAKVLQTVVTTQLLAARGYTPQRPLGWNVCFSRMWLNAGSFTSAATPFSTSLGLSEETRIYAAREHDEEAHLCQYEARICALIFMGSFGTDRSACSRLTPLPPIFYQAASIRHRQSQPFGELVTGPYPRGGPMLRIFVNDFKSALRPRD
jgi:hypothetical protein